MFICSVFAEKNMKDLVILSWLKGKRGATVGGIKYYFAVKVVYVVSYLFPFSLDTYTQVNCHALYFWGKPGLACFPLDLISFVMKENLS